MFTLGAPGRAEGRVIVAAAGKIGDEDKFRKLWRSDLTVAQIAEIYGCDRRSISKAAARFGLPARQAQRHNDTPRAVAGEVQDDGARAPCPYVDGPPFWTQHHDNRVWDSDGRYAAINALADEWRVPAARVLARWHLLRAAA